MGQRTSHDCRSSPHQWAWSRSTAAHRTGDSGCPPPRTQAGGESSHRQESAEGQAQGCRHHSPARTLTSSKRESWSSVLTDSIKALDSEAIDGAATRHRSGTVVAKRAAGQRLWRRRWAASTTPKNDQQCERCEYYSRHASRRGAKSSPMCSIHSAAHPPRRKHDGQASRIR